MAVTVDRARVGDGVRVQIRDGGGLSVALPL